MKTTELKLVEDAINEAIGDFYNNNIVNKNTYEVNSHMIERTLRRSFANIFEKRLAYVVDDFEGGKFKLNIIDPKRTKYSNV